MTFLYNKTVFPIGTHPHFPVGMITVLIKCYTTTVKLFFNLFMITGQDKVRNTKNKLQLQSNCKSNMQRESKNRTSATGKRIRSTKYEKDGKQLIQWLDSRHGMTNRSKGNKHWSRSLCSHTAAF